MDYLRIDSLYDEQELLVRQTARQFVDERVLPRDSRLFPRARVSLELIPEMGRLGFLGANLEGYGCAGMSNVEYGLIMQELERGDSGLRSFVSVQGALVMYPILTIRLGRAEAAVAAAPAVGRGHRLLRTDRAGFRLESRRHADDGAARWQRLGAERREDLDHQRQRRRRRHRVGAQPRTAFADFWWSAERPASAPRIIHGKWSMRASVTSSLAIRDCRVPRRRDAAGREGTESAAGVPLAGALRHRLGRDRRGHGLLRNRARVYGHCASSSTTGRSRRTSWCRKSWRG